MSTTKPFRLTVIVSLILHLAMIASVLMTMSGQLELTLANPVQKHTQMLVLASPSQLPEIKPEPKPEPKPEVKPAPKPEPKPDVKPVPKPEPKPDVKSEPEPKLEAKPESEPKLEQQAKVSENPEKTEIQSPVQAKQSQRLGFEDELIQRYKQKVLALIEAQKYYPKKLRKMRKEGKVTLEFILQRDGTIHNLNVLSQTGHLLFRNAALGALENVDKFPAFPEEITKTSWAFNITLEYELN